MLDDESLRRTVETGEAVYWSRSRKRLWHKGETSGHTQRVVEVRVDCDADAIVLRVESKGGVACHTGRRRCFFGGRFWSGVRHLFRGCCLVEGLSGV